MGTWLTELRRNLPRDVVLHVVGTKADIVAKDPSSRQVPFERCIAYVAENLAPGQGNTPPPTASATPMNGPFANAVAANMASTSPGMNGMPPSSADPHSPSSKRSSGFWGQEVGWDACHEISAESGEGVEEVFRVVARKLVEQNRQIQQALLMATATPQQTPGGLVPEFGTPMGAEGMNGYFEGANMRGGSFRVGKDRRSWLFSPAFSPAVTIQQGGNREEMDGDKQKSNRCC